MNHRVGGRQVQAGTAGLQADQENRDGSRLESLHLCGPVARLAVEIAVPDAQAVEPRANMAEHGHELAENQHPVTSVYGLQQQFF